MADALAWPSADTRDRPCSHAREDGCCLGGVGRRKGSCDGAPCRSNGRGVAESNVRSQRDWDRLPAWLAQIVCRLRLDASGRSRRSSAGSGRRLAQEALLPSDRPLCEEHRAGDSGAECLLRPGGARELGTEVAAPPQERRSVLGVCEPVAREREEKVIAPEDQPASGHGGPVGLG